MTRKATAIPGVGIGANTAWIFGRKQLIGPEATDLFGAVVHDPHGSLLGDEFLIPPFSVLNAREGWWQERKRKWLALGIKSEVGRGGGQAAANDMSDTIRRLKPTACK